MADEPLYALSLVGAAARLAKGDLSSVELTQACLERSARLEGRIRAWCQLDEQRALAEAQDRDRQHRQPSSGPLHGIPIAIKDIIDVAGMPTGMGSPLYDKSIARKSARVVRKLEAAGAYVLGKTVTAEFAFLAPGKTTNPWNVAHTPGGSSSGSAAAVAAGFAPAAIGTQTNGSVVRPAAFCGIVGFKPSLGSISGDGTLSYSPTLDQTGVFTRSVGDAAYLVSCIAERTIVRDTQTIAAAPRLIAVRSPAWPKSSEAQRAEFASNVARLRECGATIEEAELPPAFDRAHAAQRCIMAFEAAQFFAPLQREERQAISAELNAFVDEGNAIDDGDYHAAMALRGQLQSELAVFLRDADAIITPPAAGEAPATLTHTGDPAFCTIWTLCGVPALSIPVGFGAQGLPLGLQIVGHFNGDDDLLAVAQWCEQQLPFNCFPFDTES